jgi:transketolase C-terminal domain/subunit
MKKEFFDEMDQIMKTKKDVYLLFGGLGYPRVDTFLKKYPKRAFNCEASEQTMLDIAVGLSYAGKYPVTYTITPFYYRAFETLRTYVSHEKLPMLLVGAGRNDDYSKHDGYSHDATDFPLLFGGWRADEGPGLLPNVRQYYPDSVLEMRSCLAKTIKDKEIAFLSIRR